MNQVKSKYQEFLSAVLEELKQQLGEGYNIQFNTVLKNNSISLDGVVILKDGVKLSPNIYLNEYFECFLEGESIESIVQSVIQVYSEKVKEKGSIDVEFTFEAMKQQIIFRIVNLKKNQELLKDCPYETYLDFAITFHCLVHEESESIGTIRITNEHLKLWNITKKELCQCALENTPALLPPLLRPMEEVLKELLTSQKTSMDESEVAMELKKLELEQELPDGNQTSMYILSNSKGINGASCLIYPNVIQNFARLMQCDVFILPSSIHEVILLPAREDFAKEQLEEMVREINQTEVPTEDILSNHVYYYSLSKKQILCL